MTVPLDYSAIDPKRQQTVPLGITIACGPDESFLNSDYLRVASIEGQEQVSTPYQFNVELKANNVDAANVDGLNSGAQFNDLPSAAVTGQPNAKLPTVQGIASALLGRWVQLRIGLPHEKDRFDNQPLFDSPSWEDSTPSRYFAGIVSSVSHGTPGVYQLKVESPLLPATLRNRYYIYKGLNIQEVIQALLTPETQRFNQEFKLEFKLSGQATTRVQDWMQAGESDFAMLQRMMGLASIHFYFIHSQDGLTLVFSNQITTKNQVNIPGAESGEVILRYSYTNIEALRLAQSDLFCDLNYEVKMVQQSVDTVLTRQEAVWETNNVAQYYSHTKRDQLKTLTGSDSNYFHHKCYAYGVDTQEVEQVKTKLLQQLNTEQGTLTGTCTSELLSPGYTFTLSQVAINPTDKIAAPTMPSQFDGQTFVVTKISHKVSTTEGYKGSIEATSVANTADNSNANATFITPFDMNNTSQGSVLAKVLETQVPKDQAFFEMNNFDTSPSATYYGVGSTLDLNEVGCLVQFATDYGTDITHWVSLSESSTSAPAVHSMVMVGRGSNQSEIPQIQQVVASHGQKTIQPAWVGLGVGNNSWTPNTSWGSSISTSYSDSISIHFDSNLVPDLAVAKAIVLSAYNNPGPLAANLGSTSFNKGSSFSYSTTDKGALGLANVSISEGCSFGESHSEQSYNISFTGCSQSFSKVNKSVSRSYMGAFSDTIDTENLSFINGNIPEQSIIDICDALPDGSSYSQNYVTGQTINLSGTGTEPPSSYDSSATVYSNAQTVGKVVNVNSQTGNTTSDSTTIGDNNNSSFQLGNRTNLSTSIGNDFSVNTQVGATESINTFVGAKADIQTTVAATSSISTNISKALNINTSVGENTNISTNIGVNNSINTNLSDNNNINTSIGVNNSLNTTLATNNTIETNIAANNTIATNISANNETRLTVGATNSSSINVGAKSINEVNISATDSNSINIGASNELSLNLSDSTKTSLSLSSAMNTDLKISDTMDISMSMGSSIGFSLSSSMSANFSFSEGVAMVLDESAVVKIDLNEGGPEVGVKGRIKVGTAQSSITMLEGIMVIL